MRFYKPNSIKDGLLRGGLAIMSRTLEDPQIKLERFYFSHFFIFWSFSLILNFMLCLPFELRF